MDLGNTDATSSLEIRDLTQGEAGQTSQGRASEFMAPAKQAGRGLLNQDDTFNKGLSYGDSATIDAIRSKYKADYNRAEKKISHDTLLKADESRLRSLQVTSDLAGKEVEMNRQKEILKWKQKQAKRQAKAALVGSVLGLTGAAAGAAIGGPAGAMVGMSAGTAAGNMAGGM